MIDSRRVTAAIMELLSDGVDGSSVRERRIENMFKLLRLR